MRLKEIIKRLGLDVIIGEALLEKEVCGVYICDLLSNVMAHAKESDLWITIQTHQNTLAVASLLNLAAILLPEDLQPDTETKEKALKEGIVILSSKESSFRLAGLLYEMGIKGEK